jgi:hypothetical protein
MRVERGLTGRTAEWRVPRLKCPWCLWGWEDDNH